MRVHRIPKGPDTMQRSRTTLTRSLGLLVAAAMVVAACGGDDDASDDAVDTADVADTADDDAGGGAADAGGECDAALQSDIDAAIEAASSTAQSTGPNGETAKPASDVVLTDDEVAEVQALGATAAIVFHTKAADWSLAQEAGLKAEFERLGIEVIAVTDAGFDTAQQITDIETVMAQSPSIIVSIPVDAAATADAYKAAADAGTELVFMDNVAQGLTQGEDYVSVVSADNYGNGVVAAHLMAKALCGEGNVATVYHGADFFVTRQRYEGFKETITSDYPNISIVDEKGIDGADFATLAQDATNAILASNQDLDGIWAVWETPAEGVMAAIRSANRNDVVVITEDLGTPGALEMARGGLLKGLGAQRPYDQGVTEAKLAAYGLLGKTAPDYVALPALAVEPGNVLEAWQEVFYEDAPSAVVEAANG